MDAAAVVKTFCKKKFVAKELLALLGRGCCRLTVAHTRTMTVVTGGVGGDAHGAGTDGIVALVVVRQTRI